MGNEIAPRRFSDREEWRQWLQENYDRESEVWFVFPLKTSGETAISYNDAVEEALCFGWIDGQIRSIDETKYLKYFARRRAKSVWSEKNKKTIDMLRSKGVMTEWGEKYTRVLEAKAGFTSEELAEAHRVLFSTLQKCEKIDLGKIGKSQRTLLERRIAALKLALAMLLSKYHDGAK